jgi:hypothetical protein
MRGRKIEMGNSSCILFTLDKKTCAEYGNNSPTVECNCIKQVQFRDGTERPRANGNGHEPRTSQSNS